MKVPLTGLADDLPRHRLLAVVLGRDRADHLGGKAVATVLKLELLVRQSKVHDPEDTTVQSNGYVQS